MNDPALRRITTACQVIATLGVPASVLLQWEGIPLSIPTFILAVACAVTALVLNVVLDRRAERPSKHTAAQKRD